MLYVTDLARMREFYRGILQTPPINTEWTDTWALFDAGGTKFALHAIPRKRTDGTSTTPKVKLIFAVEDVPAERARLEAMGVTLLQRSWQDAAELCDCVDPEGNIFQLSDGR